MIGGLRRRAVRALDRLEDWLDDRPDTAAPSGPVWTPPSAPPPVAEVPRAETVTAERANATGVELPPPGPVTPFVGDARFEVAPEPEPTAEAAPAAEAAPVDDVVGEPIDPDTLEQVLDDLVRPALHSDGGDITVVKIEDNDIYVRLMGACSGCPSSVMTLRMGVERLLREEFPQMRELVEVNDLI